MLEEASEVILKDADRLANADPTHGPGGNKISELVESTDNLKSQATLKAEQTGKAVTEILADLAKGGGVGEAKIPNISAKPVREDVGSRLTRAGWRTGQKAVEPETNQFRGKPEEIKTLNPLDVLDRWQESSPKSTTAPPAAKK